MFWTKRKKKEKTNDEFQIVSDFAKVGEKITYLNQEMIVTGHHQWYPDDMSFACLIVEYMDKNMVLRELLIMPWMLNCVTKEKDNGNNG